MNDENTLPTYGSKTDAYKAFEKMLNAGNPTDSWDALSIAANNPDAVKSLGAIMDRGKNL